MAAENGSTSRQGDDLETFLTRGSPPRQRGQQVTISSEQPSGGTRQEGMSASASTPNLRKSPGRKSSKKKNTLPSLLQKKGTQVPGVVKAEVKPLGRYHEAILKETVSVHQCSSSLPSSHVYLLVLRQEFRQKVIEEVEEMLEKRRSSIDEQPSMYTVTSAMSKEDMEQRRLERLEEAKERAAKVREEGMVHIAND